jgi:hypothetical protein
LLLWRRSLRPSGVSRYGRTRNGADEAEDAVEDDDDERDTAGVTASTSSSVDSASAARTSREPALATFSSACGRLAEQESREKGWERRGEEREKERESNLMLTNFSHLPKEGGLKDFCPTKL